MDRSTVSGEQAFSNAMVASFDYDNIMGGMGADLNGIKAVKGLSRIELS